MPLLCGQVEAESKRTKRNCKPFHLGKILHDQRITSSSQCGHSTTSSNSHNLIATNTTTARSTPSSSVSHQTDPIAAVAAGTSGDAAGLQRREVGRIHVASRSHVPEPDPTSFYRPPPPPPHGAAAAAATDPAAGSDSSDIDFEADPAYQNCGAARPAAGLARRSPRGAPKPGLASGAGCADTLLDGFR